MVFLYIVGSLSVITALCSGYFNITENPSKRLLFKLIASVLFCAVGLGALYIKGAFSSYGVFVMVALILGLLGDVFLCMRGLATDKKLMLFNALGYFCFGFGHVAFAAIFLSITPFNWYLLPFLLVAPGALAALMLAKVIDAKKLNLALIIYAFILGLMMTAALNLFINRRGIAGIMALVAAILFVASDLAISIREFGKLKNKKPIIYFVLFTYYIAQNLFAITIAFY